MEVVALYRYPVKSLGGEALTTAEIGRRGIVGDRQWGLVDCETGLVLTARRCPELLFGAAVMTDPDTVVITARGGSAITTDAELSDWLGRTVRLERAAADRTGTYETVVDFEHEADSEWIAWEGPAGSFHDSGRTRVSLLTTATLGSWDARRFRPNVVVAGNDEAGLVDSTLRLGEARVEVVKRIGRCVVTTRAQPGGIERDLDVLRTVNAAMEGYAGVGALVARPGIVEVGSTVEVLSPDAAAEHPRI